MRRAARTDENQIVISEALARAGCSVQSLASQGLGVPDLLVGFRGTNLLLEVKNPGKPKADQALTPAQAKFHAFWKGKIHTVRTVDEALGVIADIVLAEGASA